MSGARQPALWVTAVVAAAVFAVAYDDGGYPLTVWSTVAVAVWWAVLVGIAVGVWPIGRLTRGALVPGALLAGLAAWDLASVAWSSSAEDALAEFDRTALYVGVYALVVLASDQRTLARWADGLALAIVAVGIVALVSRLFPGSFPHRGLAELIPNAAGRLSFPLDYWNGLGILIAIGVPLMLGSALAADRRRRALAVGVLPVLGTVVYLTSSRGAVLALAGGTIVLVAGQPRRWAAAGAALAGTAGTAVVVALHESRVAVPLVCVATAAGFELARARAPRPPAVPARVVLVLVAVVLVAAAAAAAATHAVRDFTRVPATTTAASGSAHLLSGGGNGRWQFWQAALDEFRSAPLHGGGAGSFEEWWARHASFAYSVRDAHSLYLETLGELGLVGFLLVVGALGGAAAVGVRRLVRTPAAERTTTAALLGAATAYLIGAGIDWMWELTAVTVVGVVALSLLAGPATLATDQAGVLSGRARAVVAAVAAAIAVAEAIVLLAGVELHRSQAAARAGHLAAARERAVAATRLEPWSATPRLQVALVQESAGDLAAARRSLAAAIRRDADNWQLWLVASRLESRLGRTAEAARSEARARALNPRSALFTTNR